jgi:hypothetical protein
VYLDSGAFFAQRRHRVLFFTAVFVLSAWEGERVVAYGQMGVRPRGKNEEKRTLCLLRGSRQKKFSSVKFAGRFSAATNLFEGAELGARNAIFASESARLAPIIRGRATDAVATRDASGPSRG